MSDIGQDARHPMMLAARDLLRRAVDRELHLVDTAVVYAAAASDLDYLSALDALCDSLYRSDEPVVLMPAAGFHIRHEDGGHAVYGWHHVLLLADGTKARSEREVSWHYFRWRAELAGRSWVKRARAVSHRIATELASKIEVER